MRLPSLLALSGFLWASALSAQIVVDQGAFPYGGIYYFATGATQPPGSTVAVGGTVDLNISYQVGGIDYLNIGTVGVFAVSQASTLTHPPSMQSVGGPVTITLGDQALVVAESNSTAIGVLAISAGQGVLLEPGVEQVVITHGKGGGGDVTVTNSGSIETLGEFSIGIAALSLGGAAIATNASDSSSQTNALGNSGNNTSIGDGATVTVTNNGKINTLGGTAHGIVAISSGGGGIVNNDISPGSNGSGFIVGDNSTSTSDQASNGGAVTVNHNGSISTGNGSQAGNASIGIVAQSIGGSGGSAGGDKPSLFVGDKGGGGGVGGAVNVTTAAASVITTKDLNSLGVLAQSIGGGGGNGANSVGIFVSVGGHGGAGGDAGFVGLDLSGQISTQSDHSAGAVAQSIGGGGGHGGSAHAFGILSSSAGIGGKGGIGGDGGQTSVTNEATATISTLGNNSPAILSQSIGGGGGTGGAAFSNSVGVGFTASIALGGSGGGGGTAGSAFATNWGTISTGSSSQDPLAGANSIGMLVQAIGGGGGHGGSSMARAFALPAGTEAPVSTSVSLSLGGSGGIASDGNYALGDNLGQITTWGAGSVGILAQSIGGGGGNGGDSTAASLVLTQAGKDQSISVAHGGTGGKGGNGDLVRVSNAASFGDPTANIITHGQNAAGIIAQSIGGGGGNSAIGNATSYTPSVLGNSTSAGISIGLGGKSGSGGTGASVEVTNAGNISTFGSGSQGIIAQSIGGGGGTAGGGSSSSSGNTLTIDVSVGGAGGSGGNSMASDGDYAVSVVNTGSIQTRGGDATGILAQSIGGGGGNGGTSDSNPSLGPLSGTNALLSPSKSYTASIAVGGKGGSGGMAGSVNIENIGLISTEGNRSFGILAQAISGGGGVGGAATAASNTLLFENIVGDSVPTYQADVGVGGKGGAGWAGGQVQITHTGLVTTKGYGSHGIVAQSIGSGGGVGAEGSIDIHASLLLGVPTQKSTVTTASGGSAFIESAGSVQTSGADAVGLIAQSIGGGGGIASAGVNVVTAERSQVNRAFLSNLNLGFTADNGKNTGPNGIANIIQSGNITTLGDWSHGILAQSIGGGGGKASTVSGTNSASTPTVTMSLGSLQGTGNGGAVILALDAATVPQTLSAISTSGYAAFGVLGQSVGAGGGLATDGSSNFASISLNLGAHNDNPKGSGAAVSLTASGATISTAGDMAHAVVLQSIAGGGGIAATGNSTAGVSPDATIRLGAHNAGGTGGSVSIGSAQTASVLNLSTQGQGASGIIAQSIGGGGGLVFTQGNFVSGSTIGGNYSSGSGSGGAVGIYLGTGSQITTNGAGAHGIVAQSIGGGGGIAYSPASLISVSPVSTNPNETHGYGQAVTVNVDATIQTSGNAAHGIVAQVIGGGGGILGSYYGSTGNSKSSVTSSDLGQLSVEQDGLILTSGINSVGIFAQSSVAGSKPVGNDISVTVSGTVIGGAGAEGTGVWIANGSNNNLLTVAATGALSAYSGSAIQYTGWGTLNVVNRGTITGNINLENSNGQKGTLTNYGTLGGGIVNGNATLAAMRKAPVPFFETVINADYHQTRTGVLAVKADFNSGNADHFLIKGDAKLDGKIQVSAMSVLPLVQLPVLTIEGKIDGDLDAIFEGADGGLFEYGLRRVGGEFHLSAVNARLSSAGHLEQNERAVAEHLEEVWAAGGTPLFGELFAVLGATADFNFDDYAAQLGQLSPGATLGFAARRTSDMQAFANSLFNSSNSQGRTSSLVESAGSWYRMSGRTAGQSDNQGVSDFRLNNTLYQVGGQGEVADGWFVGGSMAYEYSWLTTDDGMASGDGHAGLGAVTVKYQSEPWLFSAAAYGSFGFYDTSRTIAVPGFQATAKGSPDIYTAGFVFRTDYTIGSERCYLRPSLTLNTVAVIADSYNERGAGGLDLEVDSETQTTFIATPAIEAGAQWELDSGRTLRLYGGGGINILTNDSWKQRATLQGVPGGVGSFTTSLPIDNIAGRVTLGLQVGVSDAVSFFLQYDGEFSEHVAGNGGSIGGTLRF